MKAKIGARLDQAELESGLTQDDIDKYIAFIHDVKKARGKQKNIDKAIEKSGRSETRLLYIKMKTDMACMIANGLPEAVFKDVTPAFHATEEEKALILANLERLTSTSFVAEFPMPR